MMNPVFYWVIKTNNIQNYSWELFTDPCGFIDLVAFS